MIMKESISRMWNEILMKNNYNYFVDSDVRVDLSEGCPLPKFNKMYLNKIFYTYLEYKNKPNYVCQIVESIEDYKDTDKVFIELSNGIHYERDSSLIRMQLASMGFDNIKVFNDREPFNIGEVYKNKIIIISSGLFSDNDLYEFIINRDEPSIKFLNNIHIRAVQMGVITIANSNSINSERELYNIFSSDFKLLTNGQLVVNIHGDINQIILFVAKMEKVSSFHGITKRDLTSIDKIKDYLIKAYKGDIDIERDKCRCYDELSSKERVIDFKINVEDFNNITLRIEAVDISGKSSQSQNNIENFEEEMKEVRDNLLKEYKKLTKESGCTPASYKGRLQLLEMIERANNCLK